MDTICRSAIKLALREDLGDGDITSRLIVPGKLTGSAYVVAKSPGILSGSDAFRYVYRLVSRKVAVSFYIRDGQPVRESMKIARISGPARSLLAGERLALNLLCRLSGIATLTARYVGRIKRTRAVILDTRKTTPALRWLEKKAVVDGGGKNHRFGLYDMILIKDNHVAAAGGIGPALAKASGARRKIEIEVGNLAELAEALRHEPDIIMLDNFSLGMIREAVRQIRRKSKRIKIEVSGGVTLDSVAAIAKAGVDYISVGALTHSAPIVDFSLEYDDRLSRG